MQNRDEGYIKYAIHWQDEPLADSPEISSLIYFRNTLKEMGLIGMYAEGIGFGNISLRQGESNAFFISGTQTGGLVKLPADRISLVYRVDIDNNELFCRGRIKASSESLTHAAVYLADPEIRSVIHVHHHENWKKLLNSVTTIDAAIAYGTPEMANTVCRLIQHDADLKKNKIFVTAGHEDGIFCFGNSVADAFAILKDNLI